MKYTRYDLKRKNSDGIMFVAVFVGILVLAFFIGSIVSQIVYKNNKSVSKDYIAPENKQQPAVNTGTVNFIAIQGGIYNVKETADATKNTLTEYGNPFLIVEQGKGTRVLLGIFTEEEAVKKLKELTDKNVANYKLSFQLDGKTLCHQEIIGIVDGNLQVLSRLTDKSVKSVNIVKLKEYCTQLKEVDKNSEHYSELSEMKNYIKGLPSDITKEKASENYVFIYNILKKVTAK